MTGHLHLCQIEIPVTDVEDAKNFYRDVFGLKATPADIHDYVVLAVHSKSPFGLSLVPKSTIKSGGGPRLYFSVVDFAPVIDALKKWPDSGLEGPIRLPSYGKVYRFQDPDGNKLGIFVDTVQQVRSHSSS
jgi:predicted enzyme related to lactoylglutathione lyase